MASATDIASAAGAVSKQLLWACEDGGKQHRGSVSSFSGRDGTGSRLHVGLPLNEATHGFGVSNQGCYVAEGKRCDAAGETSVISRANDPIDLSHPEAEENATKARIEAERRTVAGAKEAKRLTAQEVLLEADKAKNEPEAAAQAMEEAMAKEAE